MSTLLHYRFRTMALVIVLVVLATATYGFAAGNTVPNGQAGEGQGVISGYTVSNVVYTLDSGDPSAFASVAFDLDAAASDVYAGLDAGGAIDWVSCTGGPTSFSCDLSSVSVTVAGATALHVSSAE